MRMHRYNLDAVEVRIYEKVVCAVTMSHAKQTRKREKEREDSKQNRRERESSSSGDREGADRLIFPPTPNYNGKKVKWGLCTFYSFLAQLARGSPAPVHFSD